MNCELLNLVVFPPDERNLLYIDVITKYTLIVYSYLSRTTFINYIIISKYNYLLGTNSIDYIY